MDLLSALTGNRVNYGINTIGGVRRDFSKEQLAETLRVNSILEERTKYYIDVATRETTLIERLSGVGFLSQADALKYDAVGPTARASNVDRDVRRDDPYAAYADLAFKVVTDGHCDVYGRTLVRVGELMQTYSMIRQLVEKFPEGPVTVKAPRKIPAGEAFSRYEAPRGEDVHYVRGNGTDKPERVKVRAPTLANLQSVAKSLENNNLADVPITLAAIDPCFSCTDRMIRVQDLSAGREGTLSWEALRAYGIDWHRQRGRDFSGLNRRLKMGE
jgi:NADH-quinone oxidoreductase subunit D